MPAATPGEELDSRRRRILFRAWHRGMREMDLIMGRFADAHLAGMTDEEIASFERLIEAPDPSLLAWLTDAEPTPADQDDALWRRLKSFHTHLKPLHA